MLDSHQKLATRALAVQGSLELFLKHCAFTNDASDSTVIGARKFPMDKAYIKEFLKDYSAHRWLIVEKSRQMSISWFFAAAFAWEILAVPNSKGFIFAQDEDKAKEFIQRVRYLIENIPENIWPSAMRGKLIPTQLELNIEGMNSGIKAMTSSPNKGHGYTPSFVFFDEFGMHPEAEASYRAIAGAIIGKTNRVYIVSTPPVLIGQVDHIFFQLADDRLGGEQMGIVDYTEEKYDANLRIPGYHSISNPKNGFQYIRLHYSTDPERNEEWAAPIRAKMSPDAWSANFELVRKNYGGLPVFKNTFNPSKHVSQKVILPNKVYGPLLYCWDFGGNHSVLLMQKQNDTVVLLHEWANRGHGTRQLFSQVWEETQRLYGSGFQVLDIIDPSAEFHGKEGERVSLAEILRQEAVKKGRPRSSVIPAVTNKILPRLDAVERLLLGLDKVSLLINPHLTWTIDALTSGYVWPEKDSQSEKAPSPLKNAYSHIMDTLQYGALHINRLLGVKRSTAEIKRGTRYF